MGKISEMIYNKSLERENQEVAEEFLDITHNNRLNK